MRRVLTILLTPVLIFTGLWLLIDHLLLPRVATWAKTKVETLDQDPRMPVSVRIDRVSLSLFRPAAEIEGLTVTPRGELAKTLRPLRVRAVSAKLDLFEVLLGRLQIGTVQIDGIEGGLEIDPLLESDEPAKPLPLDEVFSWAEKIPIRRVLARDARFELRSAKFRAAAAIEADTLLLTNRGLSLRLAGAAPKIRLEKDRAAEVSLTLAAELSRQRLSLDDLQVSLGDIMIRVQGMADDPANLPLKPRAQLKARTVVSLDRLGAEIAGFLPEVSLPKLSGTLAAETEIILKGTSEFTSALKARTTAVKVGPVDIGDAQISGKLTQNGLEIERVDLHHPAGNAEVTRSSLQFREPYEFKSTLEVAALDLQALFRSLDLHEIPVDLDLKGRAPCEGTLKPLAVRCAANLQGDNLSVRSGMKKTDLTIAALKDLEARGDVTLDAEQVAFRSDLRIGTSRGETSGRVRFAEGFKIDFKTPSIAFKDVASLANLKFEGEAAIEGSTQGDSDAATFDMKLATKNFVFEDFTLGEVKGDLRYRRGHLLFSDLEQSLGRTRAEGSMDLDLNRDRIAGEFGAEALDAADLVQVFSRLWKMPLEIQALGRARMEFDGPLDLFKMSYSLDADLRNGRLQGDSFDSLRLKASSIDGNMRVQLGELRKNQSVARLTGGMTSTKDLDFLVDLTNFRLEESEFVNRIRNNISGSLNASAAIGGRIPDADVKVRGSLADIVVDEQEIPGSFFNVRVTRDHLEADSNLFGNRIQGDVSIPFESGRQPLRIRLKTTDWAFSDLLALVGATTLQTEYESSLTSEVDLHSQSGSFERLSGLISVRDISLRRGTAGLKNREPVEIRLDDGQITLKNALLLGRGGARIGLHGENFRLDRLNVGVNADADLRLVHLFLPFLEDLGGRFRMDAAVSGAAWHPQILGNASIQNGFIKIKGFPHPVEKLQTDILFSQSRILVQGLNAQLAGGTVTGEGSVQINGVRDVPVNIRLKARGLNMNVPDKVRTSGDADLQFAGRWFPFVLSGTYNVSSALVEMEFGGGGAATTGPRVSPYLPKILRESQFDPVVFDLNVVLGRNIVVRNSMVEGQVTGQIQVKGPPDNPVLGGRIVTERGTKATIKDKVFDVTTGTVTFNNPEEINPELYVVAQTRVDTYDINVVAQGPAKNPTIRMTSTPPLAESDIISLLALGITSTQLEGQKNKAEQVGYEALGIGLSSAGANKAIEKTFGVAVQIGSSFDQTKNISVPKVTLTRKVSDRLNAIYSRPLNSESASQQEFKLQYQINGNVSAIGSFEQRQGVEGATTSTDAQKQDILGLDLEFKREFK